MDFMVSILYRYYLTCILYTSISVCIGVFWSSRPPQKRQLKSLRSPDCSKQADFIREVEGTYFPSFKLSSQPQHIVDWRGKASAPLFHHRDNRIPKNLSTTIATATIKSMSLPFLKKIKLTTKHLTIDPSASIAPTGDLPGGKELPESLPDVKKTKLHPSNAGRENVSLLFVGTASTIL